MSRIYIDRKPVGGDRRVGARADQKRRWDTENKRDRCACGRMKWKESTQCRSCFDRAFGERRSKARELRAERGLSYAAIGRIIGCSRMMAWRYVNE